MSESSHEEAPLWYWNELCRSLGVHESVGPDISGINIDSRLITDGDLFIALPGDPGPRFQVSQRTNRDGHDYVSHAKENGALAALVQQDPGINFPHLHVENTIDGLWEIARFRRRQLRGSVIAITGSSGKTTLKAFASQALAGCSIEGSLNNYIGLPLSMTLTPRHTDIVVYEIGTNHPGEIRPLAELAQPNVVVVLNVLEAHIGNFKDIQELMDEKFSIQHELASDGILICPYHLRNNSEGVERNRTLTFGFENEADVRIEHIHDDRYRFTARSESYETAVPGGGRHLAETVGATAALLHAHDQPLNNLQRLKDELPKGRGNRVRIRAIELIDESYNANPSSMKAALSALSTRPGGKKIVVLGQMNELGSKADEYHRNLASYANEVDVVFCVGELMEHLFSELSSSVKKYFFESADEQLISKIVEHLNPHDVVMVKGSHSIFWEQNFVEKLESAIQELNS